MFRSEVWVDDPSLGEGRELVDMTDATLEAYRLLGKLQRSGSENDTDFLEVVAL